MKFRQIIVGLTTVAIAFAAFSGGSVNAEDTYTGDSFSTSPMCPNAEGSRFEPVLRKGDYGLNVEYLQGILGVTADGCFGPGTEHAVRSLQARNQLYVDGIVGKCTWPVLHGNEPSTGCIVSVATSSQDPEPIQATSQERDIEIDQWREVVRLKVDGSIVDTMPMIDNHYMLAKGTYSVCGFTRNNLDVSWSWLLPNFVRLCDDNGTNTRKGFHAIPVSTRTGNVMHDDSYLGTGQKQSSGCIRLSLSDSQILWDFAKSGMKVIVM